jgi:hypothetical protein
LPELPKLAPMQNRNSSSKTISKNMSQRHHAFFDLHREIARAHRASTGRSKASESYIADA